jgi:hypothetical protein
LLWSDGESHIAASKALLPSRKRLCELCTNVCAGFDARFTQAFGNVKQASGLLAHAVIRIAGERPQLF